MKAFKSLEVKTIAFNTTEGIAEILGFADSMVRRMHRTLRPARRTDTCASGQTLCTHHTHRFMCKRPLTHVRVAGWA